MDRHVDFGHFPFSLKSPSALYLPILASVLFIGSIIFAFHEYTARNFENINSSELIGCLEGYGLKGNILSAQFDSVSSVYSLCHNIVATDLTAQEQIIRNQNYVFQRSENIVLMVMVVLITLSGVVLAALQLLASYKLASLGKGSLSDGGEVNLTVSNLAVKSSVVGVTILAISFAFFLVFVLYVYTIKTDGSNSVVGAPPPPPNAAPAQPFMTPPVSAPPAIPSATPQ